VDTASGWRSKGQRFEPRRLPQTLTLCCYKVYVLAKSLNLLSHKSKLIGCHIFRICPRLRWSGKFCSNIRFYNCIPSTPECFTKYRIIGFLCNGGFSSSMKRWQIPTKNSAHKNNIKKVNFQILHENCLIILSSGSLPSAIAMKISGWAKKSEYISRRDRLSYIIRFFKL